MQRLLKIKILKIFECESGRFQSKNGCEWYRNVLRAMIINMVQMMIYEHLHGTFLQKEGHMVLKRFGKFVNSVINLNYDSLRNKI